MSVFIFVSKCWNHKSRQIPGINPQITTPQIWQVRAAAQLSVNTYNLPTSMKGSRCHSSFNIANNYPNIKNHLYY